jgi:hypothetical protein
MDPDADCATAGWTMVTLHAVTVSNLRASDSLDTGDFIMGLMGEVVTAG